MNDIKKPSMDELMKTAQKMQEDMKRVHGELSDMEIVGKSGGGLVTVILNGRYYCNRVIIESAAQRESAAVLEDLVAAAINDAVAKVEKASQDQMIKMTKDLGLPDGLGLPGGEGGEDTGGNNS